MNICAKCVFHAKGRGTHLCSYQAGALDTNSVTGKLKYDVYCSERNPWGERPFYVPSTLSSRFFKLLGRHWRG